MSKMLCKALRKDGSPCKGHALEQYGGYCIAHGPTPEQAHEWRSRGGKNSATAVRIGKNTPERFTEVTDVLDDCIKMVIDGSLSPARFDAVCRGLQMKLDTYRLGDQETERVRTEKIEAVAAQHLDVNPDLDVLKAVDLKKAEQDRYRRESLVHQGFACFSIFSKPDEPPDVVLNDKGRRSLGLQNYEDTQYLLERTHKKLLDFDPEAPELLDLPQITELLDELQEDVEETLSGLPHVAARPFDPLTGQPVTKLPAGVLMSPLREFGNDFDEDPQESLTGQLSFIAKLKRRVEEKSENELYKRRLAEQEQGQAEQGQGQGERARLEANLQSKIKQSF